VFKFLKRPSAEQDLSEGRGAEAVQANQSDTPHQAAAPNTTPAFTPTDGPTMPAPKSATVDPAPNDSDSEALLGVKPSRAMVGEASARQALSVIASAKPGSIHFVVTPRSLGHRHALQTAVSDIAATLPPVEAIVIATDFDKPHGLQVLRLPSDQAIQLRDGLARAIEMLCETLPAAFGSDSTQVARMTLDEELRSGQDRAIDVLKRRAEAQNIGLLRTPMGYAVSPMHDGRVVQPEVYKALPDGLRADVDAKLASFEAELSAALADRTRLQRDHRARVLDLETDVATLAVRPALAAVKSQLDKTDTVVAFLDALGADLVRNAALFLSPHPVAPSQPMAHTRAPVEIAADPRLARYQISVVTPARSRLIPNNASLGEVCGLTWSNGATWPNSDLRPAAIEPGALTAADGGIAMIEAEAGLYNAASWLALKRALQTHAIQPIAAHADGPRAAGPVLPARCRLVVYGDSADCRAWHQANADIAASVRVILAFETVVVRTRETELQLAGNLAAIRQDENLQPFAAKAIAALIDALTRTEEGTPVLATDLDGARAIMIAADGNATARKSATILARDIASALEARSDLQGLGPAVGFGP
jgi:AAA domain